MLSPNKPIWILSPYKACFSFLIRIYVSADSGLLPKWRFIWGSYLIENISDPHTLNEKSPQQLKGELMSLGDAGNALFELLCKSLSMSLISLDSLFDQLREVFQLVWDRNEPRLTVDQHTPLIEKTSPFGVFLRKMQYAFNEMGIEGLATLFKQLQLYSNDILLNQKTKDTLEQSYEEDGKNSLEMNNPFNDILDLNFASSDEVALFLASEAQRIERDIDKIPSFELHKQLDQLQNTIPQNYQSHFVNYVVSLQTGKFDEAIDSLHKFYENAALASLSPTISIVPSINSMPKTKSEKQLLPGDLSLLPHALYDEALTHFRYGHYENALQFVNEMIRLSQERNDDRALVKALTLFHRLILIISKGNITTLFHILKKIVMSSLELQIPATASVGMFGLAEHYLLYPRSQSRLQALTDASLNLETKPKKVWLMLHNGLKVNLNNPFSTLSSTKTNQQLLPIYHNNIEETLSSYYTQKSATFHLFGNPTLSNIYSHLQLEQSSESTEESCLSLCRLAKNQSDYGELKEAIKILQFAKKYFSLTATHNTWLQTTRQILFDWALHRGELKKAEFLSQQLYDISCEISQRIDAKWRQGLVLSEFGEYNKAIKLFNEVIEICDSHSLTIISVPILLSLGQIHLEMNSPMTALAFVLRVLTLAKQYHLYTVQCAATLTLAEIQLTSFCFDLQQILFLLDSTRPQLPHAPLLVQGTAFLLYGKCYLLKGSHSKDFLTAIDYLERAKEIFVKTQHLTRLIEAHRYLALTFHQLNETEKRNENARQFLELKQLKIWRKQQPLLFDNIQTDEYLLQEALQYSL